MVGIEGHDKERVNTHSLTLHVYIYTNVYINIHVYICMYMYRIYQNTVCVRWEGRERPALDDL